MRTHKILIPLAAGTVVLAGVGIADAASKPHPRAGKARLAAAATKLKAIEHGTFVVRQGTKDVTVTVARGSVSAVSATSVTVTSLDHTATTFAITASTRVRQLGSGLTTAASVHTGQTVTVTGQAGTAKRILIAAADK